MVNHHKGTKSTKVFESTLFFVSFVHFVVEKRIFQGELIPFFNQVIVS